MKFFIDRLVLGESEMSKYMTLSVTRFAVCSEEEDVEEASDPTSFEQADDLLIRLRNEQPDKAWSLVAEIDA